MRKGNLYKEEQKDGYGGVYAIVNVLDCEVYVGQSTNLAQRAEAHREDLDKGMHNNKNLQNAYNHGAELIYFLLAYESTKESDKQLLLDYEKLFMFIFEEYGHFILYNSPQQPKKENRSIEGIRGIISDGMIREAKKTFDEDFKRRFGKTAKELTMTSYEEREKALKSYLTKKGEFDFCYFDIKHMVSTYNMKSISIKELNFENIIISSAGTYINEEIEQILEYESRAINKYGYCLWTFGKKKLNIQFAKTFCEMTKKQGKDIYVLFRYTPSKGKPSTAESYEFSYFKDCERMSEEERQFLGIIEDENGRCSVKEDIDTTGTSDASRAFVIEELAIVRENFDLKNFLSFYNAMSKTYPKGKNAVECIKMQHDTSCLQIKNTIDFNSLEMIEKTETTNYFVGKLAAPYIVDLEQ